MKKIIALSFSGFCLLFSMGCFNDLLSDSKKANDVKFMTYGNLVNRCGQADGSNGYIRFNLDGQDVSIMNCKAYHCTYGTCNPGIDYWKIGGRCDEEEVTIYIGDGTIGAHNTSSWSTMELIEYLLYLSNGTGHWWYGVDYVTLHGTAIIDVTLHDSNSIKGTFSGTICDWDTNCRNVTNGEFFSVGVQIY